jgi:hypothetical protein
MDTSQPEPLDDSEKLWVRMIQIALRALKRCAQCGVAKPVRAFPRYGAEVCKDCDSASAETWWAQMKLRLLTA